MLEPNDWRFNAERHFGRPADIVLGEGRGLWFTHWEPSPAEPGAGERIERIGAIITHPAPDGGACWCGVAFRGDVVWHVEAWEPLTISPSVLCLTCKDHGFIRGGQWVSA